MKCSVIQKWVKPSLSWQCRLVPLGNFSGPKWTYQSAEERLGIRKEGGPWERLGERPPSAVARHSPHNRTVPNSCLQLSPISSRACLHRQLVWDSEHWLWTSRTKRPRVTVTSWPVLVGWALIFSLTSGSSELEPNSMKARALSALPTAVSLETQYMQTYLWINQ